MIAYDYDKQVWVQGSGAVSIRAAQLREELSILRGPRALEYLRFNGALVGLEQAIASVEMELAGLDGQL